MLNTCWMNKKANSFQVDIQAGRKSKKGRNVTEVLLSASFSDVDFEEVEGRELRPSARAMFLWSFKFNSNIFFSDNLSWLPFPKKPFCHHFITFSEIPLLNCLYSAFPHLKWVLSFCLLIYYLHFLFKNKLFHVCFFFFIVVSSVLILCPAQRSYSIEMY